MSVINTNAKALVAQNSLSVNNRNLTKAMEQLSTGKRVNTAADDAAGQAISQKMTAQIRGLDQAVRNANDGVSLLQTVEGSLVEVSNMLQRMRELAVQSATDTNTSDDRNYLDLEYKQLMSEITRISKNTQWNGMNVMNNTQIGTDVAGVGRDVKFQVGANADQTISITLKDFTFGTGTPATPSVKEFNFAAIGSVAVAGMEALSGATTFTLSFGATGSTGINAPTDITFTVAAIGSAVPTDAEIGTINAALKTAIQNRVGFENVQVSKSGSTLRIEDSEGRTIGALKVGSTALTSRDGAGTVATDVAAGVRASGATAPTGADKVFAGKAAVVGVSPEVKAINVTSITSQANSNEAIDALDLALKNVNNERATMGAVINRLNYAADNLANVSMNTSAARSRVLDTDYAKTTTELARTQIISQAATAMLAQANQQPAAVLSLLQ